MNVQQLVDAIANFDAPDALPPTLSVDDWKLLAPYLSLRFLSNGEALMRQGENERELFILAEGELQVLIRGTVVAQVMPGAVVGEGTFFSGASRSATVKACKSGVAWALSWERYEAMAVKHPKLALDLTISLASVLANRMREAILVGQFT
jgi:CRP/FNR family transcriptional regulator, cyclic AMP receptor protein